MFANVPLILIFLLCGISAERIYGDSEYSNGYADDIIPSHIYCPRTLLFDAAVNTTGHIYSPLYGKGTYPELLHCYYEILIPKGWRVKITFKDFDLDPSESCGDDSLKFYGVYGNNPLWILCGQDIPRPIFSVKDDGLLKILFHSDYVGTGRGFHIYYEASPYLDDCPAGHILCKNRNCIPNNKKCDGRDDCEDGTDEQGCGFPVMTPEECGNPFYKPSTIYDSPDRIVGGQAVVPHSWPWQVSLSGYYYVEPSSHLCGGTLINSQWVLTAAHCFRFNADPIDYRIHLGSHHKFKKDPGEQIRYAERIIGFPDLEKDRLLGHYGVRDDIALIKLNAPVNFTKTVQPACLPEFGWDLREGGYCYTTGWGETRGSGFSDVLKQTVQVIQSTEKCSHDPKHQICVIHPTHFNSPCHGDSGGPLVCYSKNKWYLMGDTSYATATNFMSGLCAMPDNKVIFSKVSDKIDWIRLLVNKYS